MVVSNTHGCCSLCEGRFFTLESSRWLDRDYAMAVLVSEMLTDEEFAS